VGFQEQEVSEPHDALVTLWTSGDDTERRDALEHVRSCAACLEAAPRLGLVIDALEGGTVGRSDVPAYPDGVAKLLQRARGGRLSYFVAQVAQLFDVSTGEAAGVLERAERGEWEAELAPGVKMIGVPGGERVHGAMTALVRVEPNAVFPLHPHEGPEQVLVLEGGYRDSAGLEVWRGEVQLMAAGTEHFFTAFDVGCICASVVMTDPE
jgi:anti-sigma factor ChrR (cupin superfamily)